MITIKYMGELNIGDKLQSISQNRPHDIGSPVSTLQPG